MENREQILETLRALMVDLFELNADDVTLEARLYEDLDFDSIDAVDMIVRLKEMTGKAVKAEDFKAVRTIGDVVETVYKMVNE